MIYLDACALIKLIRVEDASEELQAWLDERADEPAVSSELARAEVLRTVRRVNHDERGQPLEPLVLGEDLEAAAQMLQSLLYVPVDRDVLADAGGLTNPMIRTLDAVHLASAQKLGAAVSCFVTYDKRLATAARDTGMTVVAPS